ncbi:MAG: cyclopropane-fatty-acyl-phospholipid synthase family protein [Chloroflexota bacterium]
MAPIGTATTRGGGAPTGRIERRRALARRTLGAARAALPADSPLELVLAEDATADRTSAVRVVVRGPDAVGRLLWPPSADTLGEAYLRGDIEIQGDLWTAIDAGRALDVRRLGRDLPLLARLGLELRRGAAPAPILRRRARLTGRRHSKARDLAAIRFHYDVGNEFYSLWLDRRLAYSCAYFETPDMTLDDAQEAKLDLICRKLRLEPGMRLLDIGCGWGSLVMFAAERYGVEVTGITLSAAQAEWATAEIGRRGHEGRALVAIRDYRDLDTLGTFDAVASVGMFEHVGRERLGAYFEAAQAALRPGGLFLNHGIATTATGGDLRPSWLRFGDGGFVGRYVFPDGELVTVEDATGFARRAGFELIDVQRLRPHYALTLKAWVERLEASAERARELVGEEVFRTWRIYMAASRRGFEDGSLDVAQLLLARPGQDGPAQLPLRPWWNG